MISEKIPNLLLISGGLILLSNHVYKKYVYHVSVNEICLLTNKKTHTLSKFNVIPSGFQFYNPKKQTPIKI